MGFEQAPELPAWLRADLPFRRRVYRGVSYAVHFVDDGAGLPVLLQHGNPTWSYLWRKVIRRLNDRGSIGCREKRAYRYPLRHIADRIAPMALARMVCPAAWITLRRSP
jgi:pimeloyl-ACP methyl ester carboxylesterase